MPEWFWTYSGDLHESGLDPRWVGVLLVISSIFCGLIAGAEREFKHKPAGLRTLALICVGSTLFTIASLQLSAGGGGDRTRIAAQIVTGIGFLGAGAIIRERGNVVGLTTAATIWVMASIGVLVGGGYAAAGVVLTLMVVSVLTVIQRLHQRALGACRHQECQIVYDGSDGKTRIRILDVLDDFEIPDKRWAVEAVDGKERLTLTYCHYHRSHRAILPELVRIEGIERIERVRAARKDEHHSD
ncbi:MAG: MgtC/SapB family protein [Planctomycetota bacterium]|nr:MAG: MgtC/SapB family protein [Planctomycetota bacterium]MCQ3920381.1 hypothetical protein [Planctomycetota bacterium]